MTEGDESGHEYVQAYVAAYLEDAQRIHAIRDEFRYELSLDTYAPSSAHITVFPLVRIKRSALPELRAAVEMLGLVGRPVVIQGAGIWSTMKNPRVILLDCSIDISTEREQLRRLLQSIGVDTHRDPTPPHITLLKTASARGLGEETKTRLVRRILENRNTWETKIKYVDVVIKDNA